jgi:ATP-dependent DNA ligase
MVVNHSTHDLPPPLRTNAFISIFGSAEVAHGFFTKSAGNGFTTEQYKEIKKMIDKIYEDKINIPEKYRKFVWLREDAQTFTYFLANLTKTEWFGCRAFLELCDQGEKDQTSLDTNNAFYSKFFAN